MQIYAYDALGNLLPAALAHRGHIYQCPECRSLVRPRGGKFRQHHYYHPERTACHLQGKSLIHLHIQYSLQKMLDPEKTVLEQRFPEISRVADLVWPEKADFRGAGVSYLVRGGAQPYARLPVFGIPGDLDFAR